MPKADPRGKLDPYSCCCCKFILKTYSSVGTLIIDSGGTVSENEFCCTLIRFSLHNFISNNSSMLTLVACEDIENVTVKPKYVNRQDCGTVLPV